MWCNIASLIVVKAPLAGPFFQTGVQKRKCKVGTTKQFVPEIRGTNCFVEPSFMGWPVLWGALPTIKLSTLPTVDITNGQHCHAQQPCCCCPQYASGLSNFVFGHLVCQSVTILAHGTPVAAFRGRNCRSSSSSGGVTGVVGA